MKYITYLPQGYIFFQNDNVLEDPDHVPEYVFALSGVPG